MSLSDFVAEVICRDYSPNIRVPDLLIQTDGRTRHWGCLLKQGDFKFPFFYWRREFWTSYPLFATRRYIPWQLPRGPYVIHSKAWFLLTKTNTSDATAATILASGVKSGRFYWPRRKFRPGESNVVSSPNSLDNMMH